MSNRALAYKIDEVIEELVKSKYKKSKLWKKFFYAIYPIMDSISLVDGGDMCYADSDIYHKEYLGKAISILRAIEKDEAKE